MPFGDALEAEAIRLGVSLRGTRKSDAWGREHFDEPELQSRILAARAERRASNLNLLQTVGIIGSLSLTLFVAIFNHRAQVQEETIQKHQKSAELMIKFGEMLDTGGSGLIVLELDRRGNLDHIKLKGDDLEDAIDEFLGNYESINAAQQYRLIDADMADDAFEYSLDRALHDRTVLAYIASSRRDESDVWDGVLDLARTWNIKYLLPQPPGNPSVGVKQAAH